MAFLSFIQINYPLAKDPCPISITVNDIKADEVHFTVPLIPGVLFVDRRSASLRGSKKTVPSGHYFHLCWYYLNDPAMVEVTVDNQVTITLRDLADPVEVPTHDLVLTVGVNGDDGLNQPGRVFDLFLARTTSPEIGAVLAIYKFQK